jgi:hypothetical protein
MSNIPDITETEQWTIQTSLDERWGKDVVIPEIVDVEARLDPSDRELTECPAVYWQQGDCHFVIMKTDDHSYRTQFYYGNREQFGTGIREYQDLADCVVSLLRLQADYESTRSGAFPDTAPTGS